MTCAGNRAKRRPSFVFDNLQSGSRRRVFANICQAFATFRGYRAGPVKHPLFGLLMILLLSRIAGCRGWDATADWAEAHYALFCRGISLSGSLLLNPIVSNFIAIVASDF